MIVVRPRTPQDLPALTEVLVEQQPGSHYPLRWPLPFPLEQFIVRPYEERAWVAELDGRVVGHVMIGRVDDDPAAAEAFTRATGTTDAAGLACVSVLFVAEGLRGRGVGGLLLDTAVAWAEERGRLPVLDVVSTHRGAVDVYLHRGWTEVGRDRPSWLPADQEPVLLMALYRDRPTP